MIPITRIVLLSRRTSILANLTFKYSAMRNKAAIQLITIIGILYAFAGCSKFKDWRHPDYQHPQTQFDLCRITEIQQSAGPLVPNRTGRFYYASNGNLDSVAFDDGGIVHYWKYDAQNVLVEYRDAFNGDISDFITLHRYASANGRVVRDTTWLEGASGYIVQVWTLQYDNKGRIVRETGLRIDDEAPGQVLPERVYTYDERGNLSGGNYDNEVNFLRTNKTLQFVHRNYSMNNENAFVLGYNSYHLPVAHRLNNYGNFLNGGAPSKISYSCVPLPGDNGKDPCRLSSVVQAIWNNIIFDGTFYYTPEGLPMSVHFIQRNFQSEANTYLFRYNQNGKLAGYDIIDGIYASVRHHYGYVGGKIGVDTLYSELGEQFVQISRLQYDNLGRIIREDIEVIERDFMPVSERSTELYVYNSKGNLVSPLVTGYDNKTSYLRTDPLWMFIHRNYSKNNPQGVTQYNNRNLPLGFTGKVFGFLDRNEPVEITYSCGENTHSGGR